MRTGILDYTPLDVIQFWKIKKKELLDEMDKADGELFDFLTDDDFNSEALIKAPWGNEVNIMDMLMLLRDHNSLHIGWNLAVMDHLEMDRFSSLANYWGKGYENSI